MEEDKFDIKPGDMIIYEDDKKFLVVWDNGALGLLDEKFEIMLRTSKEAIIDMLERKCFRKIKTRFATCTDLTDILIEERNKLYLFINELKEELHILKKDMELINDLSRKYD